MEKYTRNPNTVCGGCSNKIYRRPCEIRAGRVFCSNTCYGKSNRNEHPCVICETPILAGLNKKTCSRACSNKQRTGIQYKIGRPRDKAVTFRYIKLELLRLRGTKCERCGYNKPEILHIHHRDRSRENNKHSNLEIICPNCHYEEHYLEKSWQRRNRVVS